MLNKPAVTADPKAPAPSAGAPSTSSGTPSSTTAPANGVAADGTSAAGTPPAGSDPPLTAEVLRTQQQTLSQGFGKLAQAKAALHEREQALKPLERYRGADEKVRADPAAVLELHGITLEQLAEAVLKRQGIQPDPPTAEERLAALEAERKKATDDAAKAAETQTAEQQAAAVQTGVDTVRGHLESMAADFPVVLAKGEANFVFDAIGKYAVKHSIPFQNVTMDMVTAVAKAYEEARQVQVDEEFSALAPKVPRLAARFAPPKPQETPAATAPSGDQRQGAQASSVTLVGTGSEAPPPKPNGRLSPEELNRRSLEVLKAGRPQA